MNHYLMLGSEFFLDTGVLLHAVARSSLVAFFLILMQPSCVRRKLRRGKSIAFWRRREKGKKVLRLLDEDDRTTYMDY